MTRNMFAILNTRIGEARVRRNANEAHIMFGDSLTIVLSMEQMRDLCNDMAEALDAWFDERDRTGKRG